MAILPTRILEIEFDAGVWTNVTADLVSLSTRRGRNKESGAFETGTMIFVLRNDTRKYDPDYAAGTYYGKLRPNRRVRLRATYNAVTYDVFSGYLDRIAQQYGGPNDATAEFQASDFFKLLNRVELPSSVYIADVADNTPTLWWPLDEPAGSATVVDVGTGKVPGTVYGAVTLGAAGLVTRDPGSAMAVTGSLSLGAGFLVDKITQPAAAVTGTGPFSIEFWIRCGAQTNWAGVLLQADPSAPVLPLEVVVEGADDGWFVANGCLVFRTSLIAYVGSSVAVTDGAAHHVVCVREATGTLRIYVDGVDRSTGFSGAAATDIPAGNIWVGSETELSRGLTGTLQHVAIYRTAALTAGQVAAHNTAGRTPWNGDDPGTRLNRIFDLVGATGSYVIDAGEPTLQSTDLGGSILAYAQKVEETSLGRLFVARNGDVTFIGRNTAVTGTYLTSQATLVDDDSGAGIPYRFVSADVDEARIVTRSTVSREGSVAVTYQDTAALAEFLTLDETHEGLLHNSDTYSLSYAQWVVNTHNTASSRVGTLTLDLTKDPATMYPAVLARELADRVTYKRKPQNVGAVITIDMRVEAIAHETGAHYWRTSLQLSPFNLAAGGLPVGVWDTSLWDQAVWSI